MNGDDLFKELKRHEKPGLVWVCRESSTSRGLRLHQTEGDGWNHPDDAVRAYLKEKADNAPA